MSATTMPPVTPTNHHGAITALSIIVVAISLAAFIELSGILRTPEQVAGDQARAAMLAQVQMFSVACAKPEMSAATQQRWVAYAQQKGWTPYPAAGALCYDP